VTATAQLVVRVLIGLLLLATSLGKLLDLPGFARILGSYRALPDASLQAVALAISIAELALSVWLLSGRGLTGAALASAALHTVYAVWSASGVARGLKLSNCGCFGVFLARPLGWSTVAEDMVLVGLSLWLLALARRRA
jgi:methylamine utilization protein MauE